MYKQPKQLYIFRVLWAAGRDALVHSAAGGVGDMLCQARCERNGGGIGGFAVVLQFCTDVSYVSSQEDTRKASPLATCALFSDCEANTFCFDSLECETCYAPSSLQILRICGLRVVGIVGQPSKVKSCKAGMLSAARLHAACCMPDVALEIRAGRCRHRQVQR